MPTPRPSIYRIALFVSLLATFILTAFSWAGPQPAFVREELVKSEKIWPGQRLTLYITLYTTTSFSGSTRFELPKVSGMLIMENEGRPLLGSEKVDELPYIFKRHEITLFPVHSGNLKIPPFNVEFGFRNAAGKVVVQKFTTQQLKFRVLAIPGADSRNSIITTPNFKVNEQWQPRPGQSRVGDALVRTITLTADDTPGMLFPPLQLQKIDGLGLYQRPPQVTDQQQRGVFTGQRTETITYVCEREGNFTLPELDFQWWNPRSETLRKVSLKGVEIEVAAGPLPGSAGAVVTMRTVFSALSEKWFIVIFLCLSLVAAGVIRMRLKKQRRESIDVEIEEKALWQKFQQAAKANNAAATMQTLLSWLDHSRIAGIPATLKDFSDLSGDSQLKQQITLLETSLYAANPDSQWSGEKFAITVLRARKNLKNQSRHTKLTSLPELNL